MKYKVAVYRVLTATLEIEATDLSSAIEKIKTTSNTIREESAFANWTEESFSVDKLTTATLQEKVVEVGTTPKSRWVMPGDSKPKDTWDTKPKATTPAEALVRRKRDAELAAE